MYTAHVLAVAAISILTAPPAGDAPRHPIISEVLYAVPTYEGDANKDGRRSATGDEFIELFNPHDVPIQMGGYTLTDRNPPELGQMRFRFPQFELGPGEVAVVFNGFESTWVGPVGDDRRPPPGKHDMFHDAWVFTMHNDSSMTGLANNGDWVLLSAPDGSAIQCVRWGNMAEIPPLDEAKVDQAPAVFSQSVVRTSDGRYRPHADVLGPLRFSPGEHTPGTAHPPKHPE